MTENHDLNTPAEGATDWHVPLNDNFERLDTDVEVRDREANRTQYTPKAGAKFFATDTGAAFIGDGGSWNRLASTGTDPSFDSVQVSKTPALNNDVVRKTDLDAKANESHNHGGDILHPDTIEANRIEADTVVTYDSGTVVWDAYNQSVPSGTTTKIQFDRVEDDQRSQWDDSNYAITVSEAGNYLVSAGLAWLDQPSEGTNHWFTVRRNDNLGVAQSFVQGTGDSTLQATRPVLGVDAGDSFHLEVEQYEGSTLNVGGSRVSTYLSVVQL